MAKQHASSPLLRLPAEIRNAVYELAFSINHSEGQAVELPAAAPPEKALILSCHQIVEEAKAMYTVANRHYWRNTEFLLTPAALDSALVKQNLSNVRHLSFLTTIDGIVNNSYAEHCHVGALKVLQHGHSKVTLTRYPSGFWCTENFGRVFTHGIPARNFFLRLEDPAGAGEETIQCGFVTSYVSRPMLTFGCIAPWELKVLLDTSH